MYRRPKFLEILLDIRQEMAHEVDYDVDLFVEKARAGEHAAPRPLDPPATDSRPPKRKGIKRGTAVAK
jgi:hypothetical protein